MLFVVYDGCHFFLLSGFSGFFCLGSRCDFFLDGLGFFYALLLLRIEGNLFLLNRNGFNVLCFFGLLLGFVNFVDYVFYGRFVRLFKPCIFRLCGGFFDGLSVFDLLNALLCVFYAVLYDLLFLFVLDDFGSDVALCVRQLAFDICFFLIGYGGDFLGLFLRNFFLVFIVDKRCIDVCFALDAIVGLCGSFLKGIVFVFDFFNFAVVGDMYQSADGGSVVVVNDFAFQKFDVIKIYHKNKFLRAENRRIFA